MSKSDPLHWKWGNPKVGNIILEAGSGGGYTTLPDIFEDYERALGLEVEETWLLKRLLRYYWSYNAPVFPAFSEMAKRCNMSEKTMRKWRDSLVAKGFIKLGGKAGTLTGKPDNRVIHDMRPLFIGLVLCLFCDPLSKVTKKENRMEAMEQFWEAVAEEGNLYLYRDFRERIMGESLPISIDRAKKIAEVFSVSLNWNAIAEMQGAERMAELEANTERALYFASMKNVIHWAGVPVIWKYKRAGAFLRWLYENGATENALRYLANNYTENETEPNFRGLEQYVRESLSAWQAQEVRQAAMA